MVSDFTQAAGVTSPNPIEFAGGWNVPSHRRGRGGGGGARRSAAELRRERARRGSDVGSGGRAAGVGQDLTNNSSITVEGFGSGGGESRGPGVGERGDVECAGGGAREIGNGSVTNTGTLDVQADLNTASGA